MNTVAPEEFDLARFYKGIYLYQRWEVFPGHVTNGPKDVLGNLAALNAPMDMTGLRLLDIAPWNGFFSFECARRGAAEVVALGPEDPADTGFEQTRQALGLDQVRWARDSVYNVTPERYGTFDIVLCLGLLYHLRHPLLALDRIYDVCRSQLFADTAIIDNIVRDQSLSEDKHDMFLLAARVLSKMPMLYYSGFEETGDPFNWFFPNQTAFRQMVASSGFNVTYDFSDGSGWCWLAATKGLRHFEIDLEGYNPGAAVSPG